MSKLKTIYWFDFYRNGKRVGGKYCTVESLYHATNMKYWFKRTYGFDEVKYKWVNNKFAKAPKYDPKRVKRLI